MRLVSCDMLNSEMILARSIYKENQIYLTAGQSHIDRYVRALRRLGIEYVYVEDEESEGIIIPDAIKIETREKCRGALQHTLEEFGKSSFLDISQFESPMHGMMDEILRNKDIQVSLTDISITDEYTFSHSVSTSVYALLIAKQLGYSKETLELLAIGTMLHDVGKVMLDKNILFKKDKLTKEEYEYVKKHTTLGYEALKRCSTIPELSRMIALTHHERIDGSGYPRGIKGEKLHEFSRIAAIADVYDALTADRCYREKWSANRALEFIIGNSGFLFDTSMVASFIKQIAIYPNGSLVRLSDGTVGLVKEQNKHLPERPIVRVTRDKGGNTISPYEIDLKEELSLVITESQLELKRIEKKCYK